MPPVPGIERLPLRDLRGARLGLVAHPASRARSGAHAADLLSAAPGIRLAALFGPEHGFYGRAAAGEAVPDESSALGLPVHSLYGATRAPLPEWLAPLDAVVFDLASLACRAYTYGSTLRLVMEACAAAGKPLIVADRPDPLMGVAPDGPTPLAPWMSFVGLLPTPFVHSLTLGELALYLKQTLPLPSLDLRVVPADGLTRDAARRDPSSVFPAASWIPPSPAIRALPNALAFPMAVFFEAFPAIDHARSTPDAFQLLRVGVGEKQMQILAQDFPPSPRREIDGDVVHRRDFPTKESAERTSQKKQLFLDNAFSPHDLRPLASRLRDALPGVTVTPAPPDALRLAVTSLPDYRPALAARLLLSALSDYLPAPLLSTPSARPEWLNKLWATPDPSLPPSPFSPALLY